ncbi:MAG: hypothetical protein AAF527_02615 [Pseudomonadota bacterium]
MTSRIPPSSARSQALAVCLSADALQRVKDLASLASMVATFAAVYVGIGLLAST